MNDEEVQCSYCDEVVGTLVIEGGRATIDLTTNSHGTTLPIICPQA